MRSQATLCIMTISASASAEVVALLQREIVPVFTPFEVGGHSTSSHSIPLEILSNEDGELRARIVLGFLWRIQFYYSSSTFETLTEVKLEI